LEEVFQFRADMASLFKTAKAVEAGRVPLMRLDEVRAIIDAPARLAADAHTRGLIRKRMAANAAFTLEQK